MCHFFHKIALEWKLWKRTSNWKILEKRIKIMGWHFSDLQTSHPGNTIFIGDNFFRPIEDEPDREEGSGRVLGWSPSGYVRCQGQAAPTEIEENAGIMNFQGLPLSESQAKFSGFPWTPSLRAAGRRSVLDRTWVLGCDHLTNFLAQLCMEYWRRGNWKSRNATTRNLARCIWNIQTQD